LPKDDAHLPDAIEDFDEVVVIDVAHPKSGRITQFIEKDVAFSIFARQQIQFVQVITDNHASLEAEVRDGFRLMRNVVLASQSGLFLLLVMAFATLAIMIGGTTKMTTPDGSSFEMGPTPTR